MQLTNGRLRLQAGYSLKVSTGEAYSSHDRSAGISVEYDLAEDADLDAAIDEALKVEARLDTELKLVVAAALNVITEDVEGVTLPIPPKAPVTAKGKGAPRSKGKGKQGGFTNKTYSVTVDGEDYEVEDNRGLIRSGKFSPKSPSFKLTGGAEIEGSDGVWKKDRDGDTNPVFTFIAKQVDALIAQEG